MTRRAPKVCNVPGCPELTTTGSKCTDHQREATARRNTINRTDKNFYSTPAWKRLRRRVIREQPWCACKDLACKQHPGSDKCPNPTRDVNHIIPLRDGGPRLDRANVEGLCRPCHSRATALEVNLGGPK